MRKLRLAHEGCCDGHPCDDCQVCRLGRCCRNDNPEYSLPSFGDWDGPVFGQVGVLDGDGDTVDCHACGGSFRYLTPHVWQIHNLTAREYKSIFGLPLRLPLVSETCRESLRRGHDWIKTPGDPRREKTLAALDAHRPTPEQAQDIGSRTLVRDMARRRSVGDTEGLASLLPSARVCLSCGQSFPKGRGTHRNRRTCSETCLAKIRGVSGSIGGQAVGAAKARLPERSWERSKNGTFASVESKSSTTLSAEQVHGEG